MHDIKWIRDNAAAFDGALKRRGLEPMSPKLLAIDEARRAAIVKSEQAQARRNAASKEIGEAKKTKDEARAAKLMAEVAELKVTLPQLELTAKSADEELARELAQEVNRLLHPRIGVDIPERFGKLVFEGVFRAVGMAVVAGSTADLAGLDWLRGRALLPVAPLDLALLGFY